MRIVFALFISLTIISTLAHAQPPGLSGRGSFISNNTSHNQASSENTTSDFRQKEIEAAERTRQEQRARLDEARAREEAKRRRIAEEQENNRINRILNQIWKGHIRRTNANYFGYRSKMNLNRKYDFVNYQEHRRREILQKGY